MDEFTTDSDKLRQLAQAVRDNPYNRGAIADAFDLIAAAMEPCIDCGHQEIDEIEERMAFTDSMDNPATGA